MKKHYNWIHQSRKNGRFCVEWDRFVYGDTNDLVKEFDKQLCMNY
jgi:hypothetical protein